MYFCTAKCALSSHFRHTLTTSPSHIRAGAPAAGQRSARRRSSWTTQCRGDGTSWAWSTPSPRTTTWRTKRLRQRSTTLVNLSQTTTLTSEPARASDRCTTSNEMQNLLRSRMTPSSGVHACEVRRGGLDTNRAKPSITLG